ncbi:alpha/beta-hydrolase [Agrocybe pediades]|nr:alpha/beta-hydrolase [Agrocybe pediades]
MENYNYKILEYKRINGSQPVLLDVFFPPLAATDEVVALPVVVHFHGGGLVVGNRQSFMPIWLVDRVLALGYAFISADYRLLIPCTAHDIVEDLQDVFKFVASTNFKGDAYTFKLDGDRIAVAGGSAGGLCTYLAAIHCNPKPKALISLYGSGGDFFTEHRLRVEPGDFTWMGQTIRHIDPAMVADITFPYPQGTPAVETDVPVVLGSLVPSTDSRVTKRMALSSFLFQEGRNLDYYTGFHSPSISDALREVSKKGDATLEDFKKALPENTHRLFPLLCIDSQWPPSMILHGTEDDVVRLESSQNVRDAIKEAGVSVDLIEIGGQNHGFDIFPGAEEKYRVEFDRVKEFIRTHL